MTDLKAKFRLRLYHVMGEDIGIIITQDFVSHQNQDDKFEQVINDVWDDQKTQEELGNALEVSEAEFNKLVNSLYGKIKYKSQQSFK